MSVIGYFTTSPVVLMRRWEPSGGTTTTTTTSGGTTTTTTTIDCNNVYEIDVYASSNRGCYLCTPCDIISPFAECPRCDEIRLEYSTDGGTNWDRGGINFDNVSNCAYVGTFNIGICETSLIFRIISQNRCSGPIYFKYAKDSSTCPSARTADCGDCTDSETINVMPTGNTSIAFTICTSCIEECCSPCCV